jgi:hypothetical protein
MNTAPEPESRSLLSRLKFWGCNLLFALPFLAAGIYIMGISFGFLPSDPQSFQAPPMIVGLAGALFTVGGLIVLLYGSAETLGEAAQKSLLFRVLNKILGLAFLTIFGIAFAWVGLGPGERAFQG